MAKPLNTPIVKYWLEMAFNTGWPKPCTPIIDAITIGFLIFYLVFLLYGGISSTQYALEYNETSYSAWSPYMAPIKIIMVVGIFLTFLQATSILIKDVATAIGRPLA